MANPKVPKTLAVTCTNAHDGATLYARNLTTGERISVVVSNAKAIINTSNFPTAVATGDIIELRIYGAYFGIGNVTLTATDSQSKTLTMTQTTTTNAPQLSF